MGRQRKRAQQRRRAATPPRCLGAAAFRMTFDGDIFDADGALTAQYLASRGYCCANGCRNCPYIPRHGGLDAVLPAEGTDRAPDERQEPHGVRR